MNPRRVLAVAKKEFLHVLRDPRSVGMGIAIPMFMLLLFGYALTLDVDRVPLLVQDRSDSPDSRDLLSRFRGSRYFLVVGRADDYRTIERALETGTAMAAFVIPDDFANRIGRGRDVAVQLIVDGSDANTATLAIGYAEAVVETWSREQGAARLRRSLGVTMDPPLDVRTRVWFNPDLASRNFIIPGLIAVIMMVIAALLTSLTVAREWERGTMEQLISTPVTGPELILGKLAPYFAIGMLDVAIAVLMGEVLFGVPLRGNAALLFGMASLFLVGALAMGMTISIVAKSQLLASQFAMVATFLPAFLLSGFLFAIPNMPRPVQVITYVVPARYFVAILKGIYLKGVGLEILGVDALFLVLYAAAMLTLARLRFRKKLA